MQYSQSGTAPRQTVENIQNMLLLLSRYDPSLTRVNPTGVYGEETVLAVRSFQRSRGFPITGDVDDQTFDRIVQDYIGQRDQVQTSRGIYPFERQLEGNRMREGDTVDLVFILQAMLDALSALNDRLEGGVFTGVFDDATKRNVMEFQRSAGIAQTGIVDRETWDHMADVYNSPQMER